MDARTVMDFLHRGPVPRSWRWPTLAACIGLAAVVAVILLAPGQVGVDDSEARAPWYWGVALLVCLFVMAGGIAGVINWSVERAWRLDPNDRERRIGELTIALDSAVRTVTAIKTEIEEGNTLLADLERAGDGRAVDAQGRAGDRNNGAVAC
jgi:hypothetical protein